MSAKKLKSDELHAALMDVPARVGLIFHLRTMVVDGTCSTELEDLFDGMDEKDVKVVWPDMVDADVGSLIGGDVDEIEAVIDDRKLFGFLVRIETPNVKKNSYSWGYYTHRLFYAASFDDALRAGLAWATAEHEKGMKP